jgi:Ima1 N-terminal domain
VSGPAPASPFCDTCISNQTLLVQNLASFLPPEDDPDYDTYVSALSAYKAELEVKYPPVCSDCEERVRVRLQRNNYVAKTAALGTFLKRRRKKEMVRWGRWEWIKGAVWVVRGVLWWVTALGFIVWCVVGMFDCGDALT